MNTIRPPRRSRAEAHAAVSAPESIDDPGLTTEEAAGLMSGLGFLAFRTTSSGAGADSCLMVMVDGVPTRRHFDTASVGYWVVEDGHGQIRYADHATETPLSLPYSWGRIRLIDRFGARNSFVSFGGWLTGERVGRDSLLFIFHSAAPILRLPGHSQHADHLADDVLGFFGRLLPPMWTRPDHERFLGSIPPTDLYVAFLLDKAQRLESSDVLRSASADDASIVRRELDRLARTQPDARTAGSGVLPLLGVGPVAAKATVGLSLPAK